MAGKFLTKIFWDNKDIIVIIVISALSGGLLLINKKIFFILLAGLLYLFLLYRCPEIAVFIGMLIFLNVFSLIDEDLFRVPGVFRLRDIFFFILLLAAFIKLPYLKDKAKNEFRHPISKAVILLLVFTLIEMILTIYVQRQNFNFTVRIGRRYLYYILYFLLIVFVDNDVRFKRFSLMVFTGAVFYSLLVIAQTVLGSGHVIFQYAVRISEQTLSGFKAVRAYVVGAFLGTLGFFCMLFTAFLSGKRRIRYVAGAFITLIGSVYLYFSRAHWFGVICGFLVSLLVMFRIRIFMRILLVVLGCILVAAVMFHIVNAYYDVTFDPFEFFLRHFSSGYEEIKEQTGTFGQRLDDSAIRIEVIKENILSGVGFIHMESGLMPVDTISGSLETSDSGMITLLIHFGLLGVVWLVYLTWSFVSSAVRSFRKASLIEDRAIIAGAFGFYISAVFSFLTLSTFVMLEGIIVISVALFMVSFLENKYA